MEKSHPLIVPTILHEDEDIAVIAKPTGMVVNQADTVKDSTIQSWWSSYLGHSASVPPATWQSQVPADFPHEFGSPEEVFAERGGIVHRLDKETSGVLLLAKHPGALAELLRQFRLRLTQKQYICLVHGKFQIAQDTLRLPLHRSSHSQVRFAVDAEGRTAETQYQVTTEYTGINLEKLAPSAADFPKNWRKKLTQNYQGFSLVKCWPKTGRTHQIRVHFSHMRHPLVADTTYLGTRRQALDRLWCPRLFLHAAELTFTHPRTHQPMTITAPLPKDLESALQYLEK